MFLSNSVLIDVLREATQEELISITSLIENEKVDKSLSISKIRAFKSLLLIPSYDTLYSEFLLTLHNPLNPVLLK